MKVTGNPNCTKCSLHKTADRVCVMGHGSANTDVMVIGEAPGEAEERHGKPFMGKAGELLTDALDTSGLLRKDIYITNAVQCRPPDNRKPKKKEVKECSTYWKKELGRVCPKFVLLLGATAIEAVLGLKGIRDLRGKPIEQDGIIYFPCYHPSYALRDARHEPTFRHDIKTFARIVEKGGITNEQDGFTYTIVTPKNLQKALNDIANSRVISFDTETSGLKPWAPGAWVTSLGIGTRDHNWCFPLNHTQSPIYQDKDAQRALVKQVAAAVAKARVRKKAKLIAHAGKFDTNWLRVHFDVWLQADFDTMLAHYNVDENSLHGLDNLSARYFDALEYDIPLKEKHGFGPINRHCQYLGLDVFYTRKLYFRLLRELKKDQATYVLFKELTMPVSWLYTDVENVGVYVDPSELKKARVYWKKERDDALSELDRLHPSTNTYKNKKTGEKRTGVNWNSPDQLAEILFKKLKIKPLDKTPGGKYSVNESVLLRLRDKHKIPALILKFREADKNLGTFVEAWQNHCIDRRMHPSFKIHGTVTGRPSCEEPNLQQTPRDPRIRGLVDAPPGWTLVDADFSQVELRLVADASKDPELMMSYATGVDVHTLTVQRIFGIQNPTKEERKKGKAINFGFIYGMGWKKFKDYARDNYEVIFTDAECKRIRKAFFRLYRGLIDWHKRQRKFANQHGYVRNKIGRLRRLPAAQNDNGPEGDYDFEKGEAERQAINSPIQSLASDMNLMAAVELSNMLDKSFFRVVGTVHDAILMEVRNDRLAKVLPIIKRVMESPTLLKKLGVDFEVPIEAEIETGAWSKGTKWVPNKQKEAA